MSEAQPTVLARHAEGLLKLSERLPNENVMLRNAALALFAAAKDAERLDWLERQSTNGVHVECSHSGSFSGANLQRVCTVFMPNADYKADTLRAAIDAARSATGAA